MSKKIIISTLVLLGFLQTNAQVIRLTYMKKMAADEMFDMSAREKKPVLVFVHSLHCSSSRQFAREVMDQPDVAKFMRANYNCMNADIDTKYGKAFAKSNDLLTMPVLIIYSYDKEMKFMYDMKLDKQYVLQQAEFFITACKIREQIISHRETNHISMTEAAMAIGKSYARADYRKGKQDMHKNIHHYTLDLRFFKEFESGYREEWQTLLTTGNAKKEEEQH